MGHGRSSEVNRADRSQPSILLEAQAKAQSCTGGWIVRLTAQPKISQMLHSPHHRYIGQNIEPNAGLCLPLHQAAKARGALLKHVALNSAAQTSLYKYRDNRGPEGPTQSRIDVAILRSEAGSQMRSEFARQQKRCGVGYRQKQLGIDLAEAAWIEQIYVFLPDFANAHTATHFQKQCLTKGRTGDGTQQEGDGEHLGKKAM